jgi:abnormal spindle-like microcephaly-associated protein
MLAQPAQRFQRSRVVFAVKSPHDSPTNRQSVESDRQLDRGKQQLIRQDDPSKVESVASDALKKNIRRRTIYVPPEDTAVPTVFMGLFSPLKSEPNARNVSDRNETLVINSLEARTAAKKKARTSLVTAPRRAPLQHKVKVAQESTISRDVVGKNGGKENIPPGCIVTSKKDNNRKDDLPVFDVAEKRVSKTASTASVTARPPLSGRNNAANFTNRSLGSKAMGQKSVETLVNLGSGSSSSMKQNRTGSANKQQPHPLKTVPRGSVDSGSILPAKKTVAPTKLAAPKIASVNIDQKYPLLNDDVANPIMYEDNWLSHQEVVITQLVNGLFDSTRGTSDIRGPDELRCELLEIYQDDSFLLLYKRLHASVLYGALAPPKDVLARGQRLGEDLGLKRAFLDFWVETYDLHALRAAAETVIGRRLSNSLGGLRSSNGTTNLSPRQEKALKRDLETFLETFLVYNEDREHAATEWKSGELTVPGWGYRRTILRSLVIIVLLDKCRLSSQGYLLRRLFLPSSPYKSSTAALQALGNQLLPSVGDITRPLGHLDCQLYYHQHQLQEFEFQINNLAVDLRDGVILTRLVELLLYPPTSSTSPEKDTSDTSSTVVIPTRDIVALNGGEPEWPLSQHLKFPNTGRATKLYNVQIALSALSGVKGLGVIAQDVRAEDIVDGYREKTIALLWGLVGKWGLAGLVDWDDVRKEIRRLRRKLPACGDLVSDKDEPEDNDSFASVSRTFLLENWASLLARLKGLHLNNFTTSFSDGKIFGSIVDEYEHYLLGSSESKGCGSEIGPKAAPQATHRSLETRLRAVGCSSQFGMFRLVVPRILDRADKLTASLVSPTRSGSRILDRDFILGALAFLCSRLLSASKRPRAAVTLQTAWRRVLTRRALNHRVLARKIAMECAAVVSTRDRLLWAKDVIIKWWRERTQHRQMTQRKYTYAPASRRQIPKAEKGHKPRTVLEKRNTVTFAR